MVAGKYSALSRLLAETDADSLNLSFAEIERVLGFELPTSARRHQAWWANTEKGHSHARAWLSIGWVTVGLSLSAGRVTFVRSPSGGRRSVAGGSKAQTVRTSRREPASSASAAAPGAAPGPVDRLGRIGLVGCVKQKQSHAAPAADLYTSTLFRGRRAYVAQTCERWLVLSALHGVVRPDAVLEPYDVTLSDASRSEREAWAARVLRQLDAELGSCRGLTFEIHAGANYVDFGLASGLTARGATVERPAAGLRQGEQLSFYSRGLSVGRDRPTWSATAHGPSSAASDAVASSAAPAIREQDVFDALAALDEAPRLVRACDWPSGVDCLGSPGLYAWWVDEAGAADLAAGLGESLDAGRIYVGQAGATFWPSGKVSDNTLGKRIGQMHLDGKVRISTFRWTLASILFDKLGVETRAYMVVTPASEDALSAWMRRHLSIAVHPHEDRDTLEGVERELLGALDPPLNLRHMPPTALRFRLTDLRRRISREL